MLMKIIRARRSIRRFSEKPVSDEAILALLEAARWAPSGSNKQPWSFVVVRESANIGKIRLVSPGLLGEPPALLILCDETSIESATHLMDIAMAAQNILLAATEQGLGSCAVRSFNRRAVQLLLELPSSTTPELIITLGYPVGPTKVPPRRPLEEMVHWERHGGHPGE